MVLLTLQSFSPPSTSSGSAQYQGGSGTGQDPIGPQHLKIFFYRSWAENTFKKSCKLKNIYIEAVTALGTQTGNSCAEIVGEAVR